MQESVTLYLSMQNEGGEQLVVDGSVGLLRALLLILGVTHQQLPHKDEGAKTEAMEECNA